MAGRCHQEEDQERRDAERLERETDELAVVRDFGELRIEVRKRVLHRVPFDHEPDVRERDQKRQHSEMAAVVEKRQEAAIEPRQRADRQDDGQHQERATAEGADAQVDRGRLILRRLEPGRHDQVAGEVERDRRDQDRVIDELLPIPLDRAEAHAHGARAPAVSAVRGAFPSGGGRRMSAIAKPSATTSAKTGHSTRWTDRCVRLIGRISANASARRARARRRRARSKCARRS